MFSMNAAGMYHNGNLVCTDTDGPATQVEVCEITGIAYSGPNSRRLFMAVSQGAAPKSDVCGLVFHPIVFHPIVFCFSLNGNAMIPLSCASLQHFC